VAAGHRSLFKERKILRVVTTIAILLFGASAYAQSARDAAPINQKNKSGERHGLWYIQQPARMGEPASAEWGTYIDGRKSGIWYSTQGPESEAGMGYSNGGERSDGRYFTCARPY
jgi:hypothetical protein